MSQEIKHRITTDEIEQAAIEFKGKQYKFDAFISYRHVEPDQSIAKELHKMIESFRAPKEFNVDSKPPVFRVFRDREELAAKDLSDSIEDALRESHYLICICSKRTPESKWCVDEIQTFRKLHGDQRIIPLLIEGEPEESFPPPLKQLEKSEKKLSHAKTDIPDLQGQTQLNLQDILAADIRPDEMLQGLTKDYAILEKEDPKKLNELKKNSLKLLKTEKYRIMATILGCSFGDLKQRDKERKNKLLLSIASALGLIFLIFGLFMTNAYQKAEFARRQAVESNASILMKSARSFLNNGDNIKAVLVAKEAMKSMDESMESFEVLNLEKNAIFNDTVYKNEASMLTAVPTKNKLTYFSISDDGKYLAYGYGNDQTAISDPKNGALITLLSGHSEQVKIVDFSPDSKLLASASFDQSVIVYNMDDFSQNTVISFSGIPMLTKFSEDGSKLILVSVNQNQYEFSVFNTQDWSKYSEFKTGENLSYADISEDASEVLIVASGVQENQLTRRKMKDGKIIHSYEPIQIMIKSMFSDEKPSLYTKEFQWARFSKDKKSLLAATADELIKYSLSDSKILFQKKYSLEPVQGFLFETQDGKKIIFKSGIFIYMIDAQTGEELEQIYFEGIVPKHFAYHHESNTLIASSDNESLAIWRNGVVIERNLQYKRGVPTELSFIPDGSKVVASSRENQVIKIIDIKSKENLNSIAAQMVCVSNDNSKILFYDGLDFLVYNYEDSSLKKADINNPIYLGYVSENRNYKISNDGRLIAKIMTRANKEKMKDEKIILFYDLKEAKEYSIPMQTLQIGLTFMPDSKSVLVVDEEVGLRIYNIETQELIRSFPEIKTNAYKLLLSDDGNILCANRVSGTTDIYDLNTGELIDKISGEALYIDNSKKALEIYGLNNNTLYQWTQGADTKLIPLDERCEETPVSFGDVNLYNHQSKILLMIRNNDVDRVSYVVDFDSGKLMMSFRPSIQNYKINGAISSDGKKIMLDQFEFYDSYAKPDEKRTYFSTAIYEILSEDRVLKKVDEIRSGRELTEEEKMQIGIK